MTKETIIPTSIENVRGVAVQHNHKDGKVKIVLEVDRCAIDLNTLAEIEDTGAIYLTIRSAQESLPVAKDHPGQMSLDGLGQQEGRVTWYAVRLMQMPTDETKVKRAEQALKPITGYDLKDLRHELQSLPMTIAPKVSEIEAVEMKLALEGLGCVVSLEGWPEEEEPCCVANAADPVAHSFDCPTLEVAA